MSAETESTQATTNLTVVPSIDTQLDYKSTVVVSPSSIMWQRVIATGTSIGTNPTSISFQFNPAMGAKTFIDRYFLVECPMTVTLTGTVGTSGPVYRAGYDAPRAYPLTANTQSIQVTMNNQTYAIPMSYIVPYLPHFWDEKADASFPAYLDTVSDYTAGAGLINNPLAGFEDAYLKGRPRGSFPLTKVTNGTAGGVPYSTITFTVWEPILIPLLHDKPGDGLALTGVQNCTINFALKQFNRIWSHSTATTYAAGITITGGFSANPVLHLRYSGPPVGYIPRPLKYRADMLQSWSTPLGGSLVPGASTGLSPSGALMISTIPRYIYVWVREADVNLTPTSADTACTITQISLQLGDFNTQLSNADTGDLYQISRANGLKDTFEKWIGISQGPSGSIGTSGSFMRIDVGRDLILAAGLYVGAITSTNLTVSVAAVNNSPTITIANPTLWVVAEYPQYWQIDDGVTTQVLGLSDGVAAGAGVSGGSVDYVPYSVMSSVQGGGFRDMFSKLIGFAKESGLLSRGLKAFGHPNAAEVASKMGYGASGGAVATPREIAMRLKH